MSEKKGGLDFTTGNPLRLLMVFSIPMLIGSEETVVPPAALE